MTFIFMFFASFLHFLSYPVIGMQAKGDDWQHSRGGVRGKGVGSSMQTIDYFYNANDAR